MVDEFDSAYQTFLRNPKKGRNDFLRVARPFIEARAGIYRNAPVPTPAVIGHGQILALQALDRYKPTKAGLRTHLENSLRGLSRFVNQNKNVARIPEHRSLKIGAYKAAAQRLMIELGRQPSPQELADELAWPLKDVRQMEVSIRGAVAESESFGTEASQAHNDRFYERLQFHRYSMAAQDQEIVDHLYGLNGKPQMSVSAIATKLSVSSSKVYQIRQRLARIL